MGSEIVHVENVKRIYSGELVASDMSVLERIRELFTAVIEARAPFNLIAEIVAAKLLILIRSNLNLSLIKNTDALFFSEQLEGAKTFLDDNAVQASEAEILFSKDVVGVVDFSIRNGINFELVANMLSHDLAEIFRYGTLDKALRSGFRPKCEGYRFNDEDSVGEVLPEQS